MALSKLVLSDFGILREPVAPPPANWDGRLPLHSVETAYARMLRNLDDLKQAGAITSSDGLPWENVSGFEKAEGDDPAIVNPSDIFPSKMLRLLFWGSPHPNPSSNDNSYHGSIATAAMYKTQAFESMAWLCPRGLVAMTFPAKYRVEFYQPVSDKAAAGRILICAKMSTRLYVPMASSDGLRYTIPDAMAGNIMVAMLVPPDMWPCVVLGESGCIDFGETMQRVLDGLTEEEYGCALGVYDCSLEMELLLASSERH